MGSKHQQFMNLLWIHRAIYGLVKVIFDQKWSTLTPPFYHQMAQNSLEIARFERIGSSTFSRYPVLLWSELSRKSCGHLKMDTKQGKSSICNAWSSFWLRICENLAIFWKIWDVLEKIVLLPQKELDNFLEILITSCDFWHSKNPKNMIFEVLVNFSGFLVLGVGEIPGRKPATTFSWELGS